MMTKLIAFDLDGTLAQLGKGIKDEDRQLLRELEEKGIRIAICSGKPVDYLCGLMRQAELKAPILLGENGAVIQFGVDLPPKEYYIQPYSAAAKKSLSFLKEKIETLLPHIWFQPNIVGLTPFPETEEEFALIERCVEENREQIQDVILYRHCDSFDITPKGITKFSGMAYLGKLTGILPEEVIAVGDGVNDYPMFAYAGFSVGIQVVHPEKVDKNFQTSTEALRYLLNYVEEC